MKTYEFEFTTEFLFDKPIINHNFILKCMPKNNGCQRIFDEKLTILPSCRYSYGEDSFGNITVSATLPHEHSAFSFSVKGKACLGRYKILEYLDTIYLYPSPKTKLSPEMESFLEGLKLEDTADIPWAVSEAVADYMTYEKGVTDAETTAEEAFALKKGVCQDYAQITAALLRKASIPARYAAGFIEGDGETHAWVEYYKDGAWYGVDPTNRKTTDYGYIKLGHGRDASDCSVERGCFASNMGFVNQETNISVKVSEIL